MSDLIRRLSELRCQYNCFDENERDAYHTLSEAIKALSDVPDTNVGDTISRQAAMNAFAEHVKRSNNSDFAPVPRWNDAVEIVENLPSADVVEVVRCKDCRYGHRFFDVINGITDSWIECRNPDGLNRDTSEDSFCSCGEQKDG